MSFFEVKNLPEARSGGKEGCTMSAEIVISLLSLGVATLALLVSVVTSTFNITWLISHDKKDNDSKKAK